MAYNAQEPQKYEYPPSNQYPGQYQNPSHYPQAPGYPAGSQQMPGTGPQYASQNPPVSQGYGSYQQSHPNSVIDSSQYNGSGGKSPWNPEYATSYNGPDIGSEDVGENDAEENLTASAPPYDAVVAGYEFISTGNEGSIGPPPPYDESFQTVPANIDSSRVRGINDDDARAALLAFVGKKSCWGSGAAEDMKIKDIVATSAFHYVLETYTEGRSTGYTQVPFKGGLIDSPHNGPAPLPWDIPCSPSAGFFKSEVHKIPVPHTDIVRPCHLCFGRGFTRCGKCRGRGRVRCGFCHGHGNRQVTRPDGRRERESCIHCNGYGRKNCHRCRGCGCITCVICAGYGSVKQYIQLTVSFTNRHSDHIIERSDLPNDLIRNVQGDTLFEQTLLRVSPIEHFYEEEINNVSKNLVTSHVTSWPSERILQQRQYLRSVPVHECHFEYNNKHGRFWVYGNQREVYTEDYPHTCCCCRCTIM